MYDNIKRTEAMLEEYEEKLLLFDKFQRRSKLLNEIKVVLNEDAPSKQALLEAVAELEKLD